MKFKFLFILIVVFFLSCKKTSNPAIVSSCVSKNNVSFQNDIIPIFEANCKSCHSGKYASGNLNLDSSVAYENLIDPKSGYIDTINPTYSLLYASMISEKNPMPPNGKLDKCITDLILKWIQQKAKNN